MGLYSMPNVADAFLPLVLFARALMPLALLKDWIVLRVTGHGRGRGYDQEEASRDSAEDTRRPRKLLGLHATRFRSLCSDDAGDMDCCCAVCLHEFEKDEEISQVLACSHFFHRGCLDRWLLDHNRSTCPLCRTPTALMLP